MTAAGNTEFDAYAERYESALQAGLRYSGEDSSYFAHTRIEWVRRRLLEIGAPCARVLDFGCGTGSTAPLILDILGAEHVIGTDVSEASLERARVEYGSEQATFRSADAPVEAWADLAYCNGVFHHIAPAERPASLERVRLAMRPGGVFALWENNPWNPGTRFVMSRVEFDRDAITLTPPETRALLVAAGFELIRTDSLFYFPRSLARLRPLEPRLARIPLGGQYMVLARRPR